ncbi:hypothetical protein PoB_003850300 [Plakobranchus ocellatus]|uniref:Uncharacterized protein n=1 Tax=Plakobranchus ocellatus TaxID=259542 RepID=A0AAV4AZR9_9GAST|nr:hypothetical protein PoB_003850300 [Plakobranchus ocellatus]
MYWMKLHLPRNGTSCSSTVKFSPGTKYFPKFEWNASHKSLIGATTSLSRRFDRVGLSSNLRWFSRWLNLFIENAARTSGKSLSSSRWLCFGKGTPILIFFLPDFAENDS